MDSVLFILGFGILGGLVGAGLFKKLHVPQVIGYIVVGLVVGATGFNLIRLKDITALEPFNLFALGLILLVISIAVTIRADVILASMSLGFVLAHVTSRKSEELFKVMRGFSIPIYVLLFVLVGPRINMSSMPWWLWVIVGVYVVGRSSGKMFGAYVGAGITGSPAVVRKSLGAGLFAQGGVAIVKADEAGRDITKEDPVADWKAADVMRPLNHRVAEQSALAVVLETMEKYRLERMPVVTTDASDMPAGLIEMTDLKHRVDREILRRRQSSHM